jgi:hypothetical protein
LQGRKGAYGHIFLKLGVIAGIVSCVLQIFPTGDLHGKYMAKNQPTAIAAMEGLFHTEKGAGMIVMGQPDYQSQTIDNPLRVNKVLSFLIYGTTNAEVEGLDHFPRDQWPSTLGLLFYSYHIMVGLGTWFLLLMAVAADFVVPAAELAVAIRGDDGGMDDGGDWATALAGVRADSDVDGDVDPRGSGQQSVHAAGISGDVYGALAAMDCAGLQPYRAWADRAGFRRATAIGDGVRSDKL